MDLKTSISKDFLDIFYGDIECQLDDCNSSLNLRILKIENNRFCYKELVTKLSNAIISFSLSSRERAEFIKSERFGELYKKAVEKLRDYNSNEGEAGELLLYCFLEAHLNAPKILTKLELKTSSNDYVKGSDGIHLLKIAEKKYHLIFGESKLYSTLSGSIKAAFESIHDFTTRDKNNIHYEVGLINSNLFKETVEEDLYLFIKSILFPKLASAEAVIKDNAFGIFAGFEIEILKEDEGLSNDEFREVIRKRIKDQVESEKYLIKNRIDHYGLTGYTFYVYVFPFVGIESTRKDLIQDLLRS